MKKEVLLSTLWIFAVLNYLYADILTLMHPETLQEFVSGTVGGMHITPEFLLIGAVLMETAIAMVILSRVLKPKANRLTNIIVGILHTLAVFSSLFVGTLELYYAFFAVIEIGCTLTIIWLAWTWQPKKVI